MAFNRHYIIPFKSLRNGSDLRLNIYDETGESQVELIPAAEPFVTQEDDDEDAFAFIRTQTGSIKVIDTGDVNWRSIMPANDLQKPVTLTNGNTVLWQGYLQSESYGGELYGNPQEREFPVQCPLSVLRAVQVTTQETELHNFAYILKYCIDSMPDYTNGSHVITSVAVQGGTYARQWLLNLVDWQNFINQSDEDGDTPRYNLYEILEDICRFWGWCARVDGKTLYLTRNDDSQNSGLLTLTYSQLSSLANGSTSAGSIGSRPSPVPVSSGSLVSTDNDDFQLRGPSKATVKSDCNAESTVVKFAPKAVREELGDTWTWVQGDEFMTGYFTTPNVFQFGQSPSSPAYNVMRGTTNVVALGGGYFCRRQIFTSSEADKADKADKVDMICTVGHSFETPLASISIERWRNYSGGSLSLKGSLYAGEKMFQPSDSLTTCMFVRIGIGSDRSNAKWYSLQHSDGGVITSQWQDTPDVVAMPLSGSQLQGFTAVKIYGGISFSTWGQFQSIPVDENLSGKLFIDFMGMAYSISYSLIEVQIGDFEVEFSRDVTFIPSTTEEHRARVMTDERKSSREYVSESDGQTHDEWNADCIYASDNNMEYGCGLLQLPSGGFMEKAPYYTGSEYPEKHLANRVVAYWQQAKRKLSVKVTQASAAVVTPVTPVSVDATTCQVLSIAHNWCDDVVTLGLLQL